MRIVYLNPIGRIGGSERVLLDVIAGVTATGAGHTAQLILLEDGPLRTAAEAAGATVRVLPAPAQFRTLGDSGGASKLGLALRMLLALPATRAYARELGQGIDR